MKVLVAIACILGGVLVGLSPSAGEFEHQQFRLSTQNCCATLNPVDPHDSPELYILLITTGMIQNPPQPPALDDLLNPPDCFDCHWVPIPNFPRYDSVGGLIERN